MMLAYNVRHNKILIHCQHNVNIIQLFSSFPVLNAMFSSL